MWQTKYASAVPKNLGLGLNFRPCSEDQFLSGQSQSVSTPNTRQKYILLKTKCLNFFSIQATAVDRCWQLQFWQVKCSIFQDQQQDLIEKKRCRRPSSFSSNLQIELSTCSAIHIIFAFGIPILAHCRMRSKLYIPGTLNTEYVLWHTITIDCVFFNLV